MIYDIRHVTTYSYANTVSFARCALRLEPLNAPGQRVISHTVEIKPKPSSRMVRRDFFGIVTESIVVDVAHRTLRIDSRARIEVERVVLATETPSPAWESVRSAAFNMADMAARSPVNFIFESPLVPLEPAAIAFAAESFPAGRAIVSAASDVMSRIYRDFKYDPKATTIDTPIREVMEKRRGVCQDFAHLMIAGLRGLGLPAAYVSGYLRTRPPPGQPRLEGADATHAWVAVWCGASLGWVGFDPTNDLVIGNDHVAIAVGRDYSDVSPVDGIIVGSRRQRLSVAVDVVPVE